ncbi:endo-beta-N-acetylglucosaminidase [Prevotella melaninogenica]|uniref:endo-beta-N-acetylglucosaminidase n=1 Tax=Prevotella melaninogenica TaxID=28132 RepID=UPI001C5FA9ED|nr:LamG-like jellyroll fold domain-containing protein [Prevotella melaninogenica]MBW4728945.1 T9SS type A sorting domain-containing protein [Prevotella melaninogenica]MBW4731288.1 T9SS type A sorting domain-containing protein [Prevotella melaninogenica]MBW4749446.1 T9SS type A sorting domain-containing protein [Prevotella melaninogenica]
MRRINLLLFGCCLIPSTLMAQELKSNYIQWGFDSHQFPGKLQSWSKSNPKINDDDNFFISRVKPKQRFRYTGTQVRTDLTETNDKKLLAWLPWNVPSKNALPDGVFDSEVFSMWPYVTHWGDWNCGLGRIPAALLDAAHKNGVPVSSVAGIPWGGLKGDWRTTLNNLSTANVQNAADFMNYFGYDGLGYNSEFSDYFGSGRLVRALKDFHVNLNKAIKPYNPIYENLWYDGTNERGNIDFDKGLNDNNKNLFGAKGSEAANLFFNYNWNSDWLLQGSVDKAAEIERSPLDLYAGINMQGGEPRHGSRWTLLKDYPISIGLWGAHSQNMFFESRGEKGSDPETQQRTYMLRTERWFSSGSRNPVNSLQINNSLNYNADNTDFAGMSAMMTARSSMSWDLTQEPLITYFNLGNGKFFNYGGVRQNDRPWANVGVQDYLPTWRWWFASKLLGRTAADVPATGLDAEFVWDDAYMGGSTVRVHGSTPKEYLHLFKTKYALKTGDVITFRYKVKGGKADASLVFATEDNVNAEKAYPVLASTDEADEDKWVEKTITVGGDLNGKTLALVALKMENAADLNLYLGEFSIVRGSFDAPAQPIDVKTTLLHAAKNGVDAKIIFNMPNTKGQGEPCYNTDVKTSLFKLWAKQEGKDPILMGVTTSWAGMFYSVPVDLKGQGKVKFGVSAVSLDMKKESAIAWGEDHEIFNSYEYSDEIKADKSVIKPNEAFTIAYVDPRHEAGNWKIEQNGATVATSNNTNEIKVENGLSQTGFYDLVLTGAVYENGARVNKEVRYANYIQITSEAVGAVPHINKLTANDSETSIEVVANSEVTMKYEGKKADGSGSRGIKTLEKPVGVKVSELGLTNNNQPWSLAFWVKFNSLSGGTQIVDMRDPGTGWPQNNWGTFWSTYDPSTGVYELTLRAKNGGGSPEYKQRWKVDFIPGAWTHFTLAMDGNGTNTKPMLYINGKEAKAHNWQIGDRSGDGLCTERFANNGWWDANVLGISLGRHSTAAMNATIDDVKFFNKYISAAEATQAMTSTSTSEAGLAAYWDFEADADASHYFTSKVGNAKLAHGELKVGTGEGVASLVPDAPTYDAGSAFVSGNYQVKTTAEWTAKKATIVSQSGTDMAGTAKLKYAKAGDYEVTLTLKNAHGSDTRTFQVIKVKADPTGINGTEAADMKVYAIDRDVLFDVETPGNYLVQVFSTSGQMVASKAVSVNGAESVRLHLGAQGVYVVNVKKDGKTLRTVKFICK